MTAAQIADALAAVGTNRAYRIRYELYNSNETLLGDITTSVEACEIEQNIDREIIGTIRLTLRPNALIDEYLRRRVKPVVRLRVGDEFVEYPQGMYLLKRPARRTNTRGQTHEVDGFDKSIILQQDLLSSPYTADAGDNYITEVSALAVAGGIPATQQALEATASVVPAAKTWPTGTSRLTIINELLSAINYTSVWFDGNGIMRASARRLLSETAAAVTYETNDESMVLPDVADDWDDTRVANRVVIVCNDPARTTFSSSLTNSNPSSPVSTVALGRTITKVIEDNSLASQADADRRAQIELEQATTIYARRSLSVLLDPRRQPFEAIDVRVSYLDEVQENKWWVRNYTSELKTGGTTRFELSRVEPI